MGTPTPTRLDHRYEVTDRTGLSMGVLPFPTIQTMIRQGRLFHTDRVSKNGAPAVMLAELPEFQGTFEETLPHQFQVAGAVMRPRPEIAGTLDATALAGVFARLAHEGRTGRLFLVGPEGLERQEKVVIFQGGVPVNAMSNIQQEHFGELLIDHGMITAETFQQAVSARREGGGRLGSALIAIEAMTPRQLHRALSIQAMERLLNAFREREGSFRFVPDDTAADEEILLFASVREIIETGLHAALAPQEVAAELAVYGDSLLVPNQDALNQQWGRQLQAGDPEVLAVVGLGKPLPLVVNETAHLLHITTDEARLKILSLLRLGVLGVAEANLRGLDEALARLQSQHYFDVLAIGRAATVGEVLAAVEARLVALGAKPEPNDSPAIARAKERVRQIIEVAGRTLSHEDLRPMYDRALQLSLDFEQPEVRSRLELELHLQRGKAALAAQKYDEARRHFVLAAQAQPEEPVPYVHAGWAQFLSGSRDVTSAGAAVREVERALRIQSELDIGHLTIGKIYRLAGVMDLAEKHLRHAQALNPHNNEAQSELRLIFSRELDGKLPGQKKTLTIGTGLPTALGAYLLVAGALFALSNFAPGSFTEWPEAVRPETNHLLTIPKEIPADKQVMGLLEVYYLAADPFFWIRRVSLLLAGLLFMRVILRGKAEPVSIFGKNATWAAVAVPYGVAIGFFSPVFNTVEPLPLTLSMTLLHVLAEQVFFIGFVTRALFREFRAPAISIGLGALLFGLYHLSYYAILNEPARFMALDVLQIGVFAGGAYAFLYWRSGGLFAPLLAHIFVNGTMMVRSYMAFHT